MGHLSEETRRKISQSLKGRYTGENNPMYGKRGKDHPAYGNILSVETRKILSEQKMSEKNPNWKGDKVGIDALHIWIRNHFPDPKICQICKSKPTYDLANITGIYNRDFSNWMYMCRSCHWVYDGKINNFGSKLRWESMKDGT